MQLWNVESGQEFHTHSFAQISAYTANNEQNNSFSMKPMFDFGGSDAQQSSFSVHFQLPRHCVHWRQ